MPSICLVTVAVELLRTRQTRSDRSVRREVYVPRPGVIDDIVDIEPFHRISMSDDMTGRDLHISLGYGLI